MSAGFVADWGTPNYIYLNVQKGEKLECVVRDESHIDCTVPDTYTKCSEIKVNEETILETYPCFMGDRKPRYKWFV